MEIFNLKKRVERQLDNFLYDLKIQQIRQKLNSEKYMNTSVETIAEIFIVK